YYSAGKYIRHKAAGIARYFKVSFEPQVMQSLLQSVERYLPSGRYNLDIHRTSMYKRSTYGARQGLSRRLGHTARAGHPGGGGQLWLCDHQAGNGVVGWPLAMDRRHALSGTSPARAAKAHRSQVGQLRDRSQT